MDNVVVVQYKMTPASQERSTTSRVSPAKFVPVALLLKLKLQFCIHIPHTKAVRMTQGTFQTGTGESYFLLAGRSRSM